MQWLFTNNITVVLYNENTLLRYFVTNTKKTLIDCKVHCRAVKKEAILDILTYINHYMKHRFIPH